jgi:hypothetical protein
LEKEKTSGESTAEHAKLLKSGLNLVESFPEVFAKADVFKKKRLLSSTFPEKFQILENQCRTDKINRALLLMLATDKDFRAKKNGQLFKNLKLSGQVEATGIEPVSKHILQKLSTCLFCFVVFGN